MATITREEVLNLITTKGSYLLIDVREEEELHNGMIPTAKNLPLSIFENAIELSEQEFEQQFSFKKFSKEDLVIFYCRTGGRSAVATDIAREKRYNAKNYAGSVQEWSHYDKNVRMYYD